MNCTELDALYAEGHRAVAAAEGVGVALLVLASLLLLTFGERLVRPLGALCGGAAAATAAFVLVAPDDCVARIALAAGAGGIASLLVLCLFRRGLFLVGAAGFGAVAHYVYAAVAPANAPAYGYYVALAVASGAGGLAAAWQEKEAVRLSSALLGGGGLAWATHLVAARAGTTAPAPALLALLGGATIVGVAFQTYYHAAATPSASSSSSSSSA